jgi:hypothetical protein
MGGRPGEKSIGLIRMEVKNKEDGTKEVIIDSEDRERFSALNKELKYDFEEKSLLIDEIFEYKLAILNSDRKLGINTIASVFSGLSVYLDDQAMEGLFFLIIQNPAKIKVILDKLETDGIIASNICNLIKILLAKYGSDINRLFEISEVPNDFIRVETKAIVGRSDTKLLLNIWRIDGESFEFNLSFQQSINLATHLIRRATETIKRIDKEDVLSIDENKIKELEERISELKELRDSINLKVESADKKDN